MSWPAKYFTTTADPETVAAAVGTVWPDGHRVDPNDPAAVPATGYLGFQHAWGFYVKGTPAVLLVTQEAGVSKVVAFGVPSMLGKSKFMNTLEAAAAAVPGAAPASFPGKSGVLKFV